MQRRETCMSLLEIKNLKKRYGEFDALKGVSFHINAGEIVALLGKNGAGKTTILNSIAGNIHPSGGNIIYKGETLLKNESRLNEFGILIEPTFIPYMNAYDNMKILMKTMGENTDADQRINELLTAVGLEHKTKEKTRAYSFGMKQRLGLAQALLHDPRFLVLDEPFVGLDPIGKEIFKSILTEKAEKEKVGVLFSSHDLEDVEEICDRIVLIDGGEKKFDGVMEYSKTYVVECSDTTALDKTEDFKCQIRGNDILVEDINELRKILSKLESDNVKVTDLEIERRTLYDLFKDDKYENISVVNN